jgi:ATP/ADP translocase
VIGVVFRHIGFSGTGGGMLTLEQLSKYRECIVVSVLFSAVLATFVTVQICDGINTMYKERYTRSAFLHRYYLLYCRNQGLFT